MNQGFGKEENWWIATWLSLIPLFPYQNASICLWTVGATKLIWTIVVVATTANDTVYSRLHCSTFHMIINTTNHDILRAIFCHWTSRNSFCVSLYFPLSLLKFSHGFVSVLSKRLSNCRRKSISIDYTHLESYSFSNGKTIDSSIFICSLFIGTWIIPIRFCVDRF